MGYMRGTWKIKTQSQWRLSSFAYYGEFQFLHHYSGTIYLSLCCDMSNINLHLVVKWNFWWHLESSTINGFRDSMSCHVTWNLHWLMENQRGYMGGTWEIRPQSQWRVHGEAKGVHEGYMRDRNPVSMKGTWRIEGGTWGVHERLKPTLNKRGTWGLLWVHEGSIPSFNERYMSIT